jgi:hypothetical protein
MKPVRTPPRTAVIAPIRMERSQLIGGERVRGNRK